VRRAVGAIGVTITAAVDVEPGEYHRLAVGTIGWMNSQAYRNWQTRVGPLTRQSDTALPWGWPVYDCGAAVNPCDM
jgi:hypothetical protein